MPASSSASFSSTSDPPRHPPRLRLFHLHFPLVNLAQLVAKLFANFPGQCAPLDVNLRVAQLSVHRWTSTYELPNPMCTEDLPSSINIARPQPTSYPTQYTPLNLNNQIKYQKIYQIKYQIKYQKKSNKIT